MAILVHAYATHRDPPPLEFQHRAAAHERRESEECRKHLSQLSSYCRGAGGNTSTPSLEQVLQHVQRVRHHFSFEIEEGGFSDVSPWAWEANALLYFPDGTLRDPSGRVLVDPETGQPEPRAEIPFPVDARERKEHSELTLRNRLVDVPISLPPILAEVETEMRSADEVAWRTLALFLVVVRAESILANQPIAVDVLKQRSPLGFQALTQNELQFLHREPNATEANELVWRYEAIQVLRWALNQQATLPFPDEVADVSAMTTWLFQCQTPEFISDAKLRTPTEILDAVDLNHRMLWAARDAATHRKPAPAALDGFILSERQHALNWLIQFEEADWDQVDIPT